MSHGQKMMDGAANADGIGKNTLLSLWMSTAGTNYTTMFSWILIETRDDFTSRLHGLKRQNLLCKVWGQVHLLFTLSVVTILEIAFGTNFGSQTLLRTNRYSSTRAVARTTNTWSSVASVANVALHFTMAAKAFWRRSTKS